MSADGRYIAFVSHSDGLSGADDDRARSVYRKDRVSGAVVLVSVAPDGRYVLVARATDAGGTSTPRRAAFRIAPR